MTLYASTVNRCSAFTFTPQTQYKPFTNSRPFPTTSTSSTATTSTTQLWYEQSNNDNSNQKSDSQKAKDALDSGFWNAISFTEQWISEILKTANLDDTSNPYARKELIYVCEMNNMPLAAVASIFR